MLADVEPHATRIFKANGGPVPLSIMENKGVNIIVRYSQMADLGGAELAAKIAARDLDTLHIMLSRQVDVNGAVPGINDGSMHKLITRPWSVDAVRLMILGTFLEKAQQFLAAAQYGPICRAFLNSADLFALSDSKRLRLIFNGHTIHAVA